LLYIIKEIVSVHTSYNIRPVFDDPKQGGYSDIMSLRIDYRNDDGRGANQIKYGEMTISELKLFDDDLPNDKCRTV